MLYLFDGIFTFYCQIRGEVYWKRDSSLQLTLLSLNPSLEWIISLWYLHGKGDLKEYEYIKPFL